MRSEKVVVGGTYDAPVSGDFNGDGDADGATDHGTDHAGGSDAGATAPAPDALPLWLRGGALAASVVALGIAITGRRRRDDLHLPPPRAAIDLSPAAKHGFQRNRIRRDMVLDGYGTRA